MRNCVLRCHQWLFCNLAATQKHEDFRDVDLNNFFVYYEMTDLWDWVEGRWDKFCFSEDMLSRAENRLCVQALLTRGRGGRWGNSYWHGCVAQILLQQWGRKVPMQVQTQAGGTNPSPCERLSPTTVKNLRLTGIGIPMPKCILP